MTTIFSQCGLCVHLKKSDYSCAAFPDGIPEQVMQNGIDHRFEIPEDNGIRWEPVDPKIEHPAAGWGKEVVDAT